MKRSTISDYRKINPTYEYNDGNPPPHRVTRMRAAARLPKSRKAGRRFLYRAFRR